MLYTSILHDVYHVHVYLYLWPRHRIIRMRMSVTASRTCTLILHSFQSMMPVQVQQEDIDLCISVQGGLHSPAYDVGRYAPGVEAPMHHFHCMLYDALTLPE